MKIKTLAGEDQRNSCCCGTLQFQCVGAEKHHIGGDTVVGQPFTELTHQNAPHHHQLLAAHRPARWFLFRLHVGPLSSRPLQERL